MEMGHGVAMGTVFGTKENVNQNQSIKLDQSKMILILKVLNYVTPPRTPRISGLKSQILKPTFLS